VENFKIKNLITSNIEDSRECIIYTGGFGENSSFDILQEGKGSVKLETDYLIHTNFANHKTIIFYDKISSIVFA